MFYVCPMGPVRIRWPEVTLAALLLWPRAAQAQPNEPDITHPVAIHQPVAVYPDGLEATGRHADVVLTVTIDAEGRVSDVAVASSGTKPFDDAAVEAVLHWSFTPATRNGIPMLAFQSR